MRLDGKVAVIYGAGGHIGGAVARAFARGGAAMYLAGRTQASLDEVAAGIRAVGGQAETAVVDALNERQVDEFVDGVVQRAGAIDVSFNAITFEDVQRPLLDLSVDEFTRPIEIAMRTQFLTSSAAARHMVKRGSGLLLTFGGGGPQTLPGLGGFKVALDAIEGLRRQWAIELGKHGVRVVTIKTGGIAESMPADMPGREEIAKSFREAALLNWTATLDDVGNVAAFLASDAARTLTSTEVNISCGAIVD
jgi:NAD(P)-dependent dehydrogenase (short-subunit alcohol dehydrogenase family)